MWWTDVRPKRTLWGLFALATSSRSCWTACPFVFRRGVGPVTAVTAEESSSRSWTVAPRWATERTPERPTFGPVVAAVSEAMGRPFMPHQRHMVDVALEVQSEAAGDPEPGAWAYDDILGTFQRRGGKTAIITPVAAHRARLIKRARMFMTAQNRDKARARFMDVSDDVLASVLRPDVRRKIAQGFEQLRWVESESLLVPFAPNEDGLHSETPHLVFVDELWAFSEEQARAIRAGYVPAFSTTNGQAWKFSTAGTPKSVWLNQARATGRRAVKRGVRLGTAFFEHGLPDRVDGTLVEKLDGEALVEACIAYHPAICHVPGCSGPAARNGLVVPCPHGFTVRPAALRSAWTEMGEDALEFLRAYGNRTADDAAKDWRELDKDVWLSRIDAAGIPAEAPAQLGAWVDEDSADVAVSSGWRDPDGVMHVELIRCEPGTTWAAEYIRDVVRRQRVRVVAVPNTGASRSLAAELVALGVPVLSVSQADVAAACVRHRDQLEGTKWKHKYDTASEAAAGATVRTSGKAWMWLKDGDPVSALGSHSLAGWAADHAPAQTGFWIR